MANKENLEQLKEQLRIKNIELKKTNAEKNQQEVKIKHLLAVTGKKINNLQQQLNEKKEQIQRGTPLNSLKPGDKGLVLSLSPRLRGADRRRMMDLGVLPGTEIDVAMRSPSGDPTAYRIRGALIALRADQANLIQVEKQNEAILQ